jgi:hypothetical protein
MPVSSGGEYTAWALPSASSGYRVIHIRPSG